ncbi:MAG: serine hydrolase domain-containing protein [Myxococcota bacterium]
MERSQRERSRLADRAQPGGGDRAVRSGPALRAPERAELTSSLPVALLERTLQATAGGLRIPDAVACVHREPHSWASGIGTWSPDSAHYLWSLTKTVTAILILREVESGALSLDRPLDGAPPFAAGVTVRQMLDHTSGIPCCSSTPEYLAAVARAPSAPWSTARFLEHAAAQQASFPPGSGWRYSNTPYLLLRLALEARTGLSFADLVARDIAAPLGLDSMRVATGPSPGEAYDPGWVPTGVIRSTATEAAALYRALFAGEFLSRESLDTMTAPTETGTQVPALDSVRYGLGLWIAETGGAVLQGHLGDGPGSCAVAFRDSETEVTYAVIANIEGASHAFDVLLALRAGLT